MKNDIFPPFQQKRRQLALLYRRLQYYPNMKGKRVLNQQHLLQHLPQKNSTSRIAPKRKLQETKSQDFRYKTKMPDPPLQTHQLIRPQAVPPALDYDFQRRQRQTLNYVPIQSQPQMQPSPPIFRSQRNSDAHDFLHQPRQNNFLNSSNRSQQHSAPRINIFSLEKKDKSLSRSQRSQNSSVKRRGGIQLTKTLLKRISGMYNDKDFQNKSYLKSNRQETTGLSGRVQDEYQLSDLDFQIHNNTHAFNLNLSNSNQLSFNDSYQKINQSAINNRESYYSNQNHQSGYWNQLKESGMEVKRSFVGENQVVPQKQYQKIDTPYGQRMILKESKESYEPILRPMSTSKTKVHFTSSPKKQLVKAKSYDLLNNERPISQSIEIGMEPPPQKPQGRQVAACRQQQKYVIQSKNKTLQQLSVKQSMVLGFDNYYE